MVFILRDIPGSAHAVTSTGWTYIGLSGLEGVKVITMVVPSSPIGISTLPDSLSGVTLIGVPYVKCNCGIIL